MKGNEQKSLPLCGKGVSKFLREPCGSWDPMLSGSHYEMEIRCYVGGATKWDIALMKNQWRMPDYSVQWHWKNES